MIFRAVHTTTYLYSEPVSICHSEVHLRPREDRNQRVFGYELSIAPTPEQIFDRRDSFGNEVSYFSLHQAHQTLTISASSLIAVEQQLPPDPQLTPAWELVRDEIRRHGDPLSFDACQFTFESPHVTLDPSFEEYARVSFTPGRPILDAAADLCHRVHTEFRYDQRATTIATPVAEVFESRRGVCQDFAHLTVACLRSIGLAARYVSGYLRSGSLVGSEESHAWVSVFVPNFGWLDLDPTNDLMPDGNHITLGWGRDYSDVPPVKGVALGGGEHFINIAVEVKPAD